MTGYQVKILERVSYRPGGIRNQPNDSEEHLLRITQVLDHGSTVKFRLTDIQYPEIHGFLTFYLDGLSRVKIIKYSPGLVKQIESTPLNLLVKIKLRPDLSYYTQSE